MAGLGNLVVKILGDTKDVKAKLNDVDKRLKTFTKTTEKHTSTLGASIKKMVMWGAAIGAAIMTLRKMAQFFKGNMEASIAYEDALTNLNTVIRSTGGAAGFTTDEMAKMADRLQDLTTFSNTAIMEGQGMLATFTHIGRDVFPQAMESALNLSLIMKQDLRSSVVMLGKALNDPVANLGALSRAGVQFTVDQKKLIKSLWESGQELEAQNLIIKEFNHQFGDVAAEAAKTFGGKVLQLKNKVSDLRRGIGDLQKEALEPLLDWALDFLKKEGRIEKLLEGIKGVALAIVTLGKFTVLTLKSMGAYFNYFVVAMLLAGNAIKLALDPRKWGTGEAKAALKGLADYTTHTFKAGFDEWKDIFVETKEQWKAMWSEEEAEKPAEGVMKTVEVTATAIEELDDTLVLTGDALDSYLEQLESARKGQEYLKGSVEELTAETKESFTVWDAATAKWETFARVHSYTVIPQIEKTKTMVEEFKGSIETLAITTKDVTDNISRAWMNSFEDMFSITKTLGKGIEDFVKSMVATVIRAFAQQMLAASTALLLNPFTFFQGLAGIAKAGAMFSMASIVENLAKGGVATKETLAVIGEGKEQEAVLPLNEDVFDRLGKGITNAIAKQQSVVNVSQGQTLIHNVVTLDGRVVYDCVNRGIVDGKIRGQLRGQ